MSKAIALVALGAMALVGLDLALRPGRHVRASADRVGRGRGIPLESLSHRFLPQLENARSYRLIGLLIMVVAAALALSACAASEAPTAVVPTAPGFLLGLWHGFIFPVAWIVSLFAPKVAIYAVPNNGGWYDFGYFLGIMVFGVGAKGSHTVYRDRVVRVRG
jgi:hypothetical protein